MIAEIVTADRGNLNGTQDGIVSGTEAFAQEWDLDATGNWEGFDDDSDGDGTNDLVQTRDHNEVNETGTIGATTGTNWADPVHDRAGNMTSMPKPSDPANSITAKYDAWNRLVEVSDGGILIAKFRYDGDGRRILKMFDTDSPGSPDGLDTYEHIFLGGHQVVETREGTGTTAAQAESLEPKYQNIWSPRYIDALILRDENTDTDGLCDDTRIFYLADANYNVTALVDNTGTVLERYVYTPYGEVTVLDADFTADADGISDYANTTLYTGREFDEATGLYYYRARYYHAGLGRFILRDPASYGGGDANVFRYTKGRPCDKSDPMGLQYYDPQHTLPCPSYEEAKELGSQICRNLRALAKWRQCMLDYYHDVMKEMIAVGGIIHESGVGGLADRDPTYAAFTDDGVCNVGFDPGKDGVSAQVGHARPCGWPVHWPRLADAMEYSLTNYDSVKCMQFIEGSSMNVPGVPGITLDADAFDNGSLFASIQLLIHEPLHDFGQFGLGHGGWGDYGLGDVVGPTSEPPGGSYFTRFYDFMMTAKCGDTSILEAIKSKVGGNPCGPKPAWK